MCINDSEASILEYKAIGQLMSTWLLLYLGTPIILLGTVTSILSFVMFKRDRVTPKTTRFMLKALSITDAVFLLLFLPYVHMSIIGHTLQSMKGYNGTGQRILGVYNRKEWRVSSLFAIQTTEMFRNFITLLIGIERYIVICKPLRSVQLVTKHRIVVITVWMFVVAVFLRLPQLAQHILLPAPDSKSNSSLSVIDTTKKLKLLHDSLDTLFMFLLPIGILSACFVLILRNMHHSDKHLKRKASLRELNRRKMRVTQMLLIVIFVSTLCALPAVVNVTNNLLLRVYCHRSLYNLREILVPLCWFSTLMYSTSNFFIYVACMPKYRAILWDMLCCKNKGGKKFPEDMSIRVWHPVTHDSNFDEHLHLKYLKSRDVETYQFEITSVC